MGEEIHYPSEYVGRFTCPLRIDRRVEALDVTPFSMAVVFVVGFVAEGDAGYVVLPEEPLDRFGDG